MYPGIPSVEAGVEEPSTITALSDAGIKYMFVPMMAIMYWEHRGLYRAHDIENVMVEELSLVCMFDKPSWSVYLEVMNS